MTDIETVITDYTWRDDSRPILSIAQNNKHAHMRIGDGKNVPYFEITGSSPADLKNHFEGFVEIFQAAVDHFAKLEQTDGD